MYDPTAAVVVKHRAVILLDKGGCAFFPAVGDLGAGSAADPSPSSSGSSSPPPSPARFGAEMRRVIPFFFPLSSADSPRALFLCLF